MTQRNEMSIGPIFQISGPKQKKYVPPPPPPPRLFIGWLSRCEIFGTQKKKCPLTNWAPSPAAGWIRPCMHTQVIWKQQTPDEQQSHYRLFFKKSVDLESVWR